MPNFFDKREFKRDKIKQRLLKQAATAWGFDEANMDGFDPVVDLLFGACAVEFERTTQAFQHSHPRAIKQLSQLLLPEVATSPTPAHTVLHARPTTTVHLLSLTDAFTVAQEVVTTNPPQVTKRNLTFSPAAPFRLRNGEVTHLATGKHLYAAETPLRKQPIAAAAEGQRLPARTLWLGLDLPESPEPIGELTFYLNWINVTEGSHYQATLPYLRWFAGEEALESRLGFGTTAAPSTDGLGPEPVAAVQRQRVMQAYHSQFVTVTLPALPSAEVPVVLRETFPDAALDALPRRWLRVELPASLPPEAANNLGCAINCFPVLNQKLEGSKRPYRISTTNRIVPLTTPNHFLGVHRVATSAGKEYRANPLPSVETDSASSYTVRQHGVGRFDARQAADLLDYLLNQLRDEATAFEAAGSQRLTQEIKALRQQIARLEAMAGQQARPDATHYLIVDAQQDEDVWIDYWSTVGAAANGVPSGSAAVAPGSADFQGPTTTLVPTRGGRAQPNDEERQYALRSALLSRRTLVTEEDIRAACRVFLGEVVRSVSVERGLRPSVHPRRSFERTVIVRVITDALPAAERAVAAQDLLAHLAARTSLQFPLVVEMPKHA